MARHHLGRTAADADDAVRGVVALHSSDPLTPHLACRARVAGFVTDDLDRTLYEERTLWRLHAMRRTLFVVPADEAAVLDAAVGRDIAARERRKVETWMAAETGADQARAHLAGIEARVLHALDDGAEWRTQELSAAVPELNTKITVGSGRWAGRTPLSSRLLSLLALEGHVVRARPAGTWRSSQYRWASVAHWFGRPLRKMDPLAARAELLRGYLTAYGPATDADARWWTGWTAKHAAQALRDVGAVAVALDGGGEGFALPDDLEVDGAGTPTVALLPGLDPTPMGWKERAWYLDASSSHLYDRNGNVGPTVWVDGHVVGGWAQRPDGHVVWRLLADVGAEAAERVEQEAAELTAWLGGVVVTPRFRTPLERELS